VARDPDTIEREIEKARNALASTLDELGTKANPQRLANAAKTSVRSKLDEPKVKYALIGAGALIGVLLLRKLFR
jgi:chaperonin GroEL (HSP60 family)